MRQRSRQWAIWPIVELCSNEVRHKSNSPATTLYHRLHVEVVKSLSSFARQLNKEEGSCSRKLFLAGLLIAAAVLLGVFWFNTEYYAHLPEHLPQHETVVLGQDRFVPGSQAALRVIVRDSNTAQPLPDATINVSLRAADGTLLPLYTGRTDQAGNAEVAFRVPDNAVTGQPLVIETTSVLGTDHVETADQGRAG